MARRRHGPGVAWRWWVLGAWAAVLLGVSVRVAHAPAHQSVYTLDYQWAGRQWRAGGEVYHHHKHFVYSPLAAAAFVPFGLLPDAAGNVAWRGFSTAGFLAVAWAWLRSGLAGGGAGDGEGKGAPGWPVESGTLAAGLGLLLPLCVGNVNIGQINLLVFALVAGGVLAAARQRWNLGAALLASVAFVKIYPLAVGLLVAALFPRRFAWRLALALVGWFALSLGLQRPSYAWGEYRHWLAALGHDDRLDIGLLGAWRDFGLLVRAVGIPLSDGAYRVMEVAAGAVLALFLWTGQRWGGWSREKLLAGTLYLGCAWMLLFGPATEAATYVLLALPLCAALVAAWTARGSNGGWQPWHRATLVVAYGMVLVTEAGGSWFRAETRHVYWRALLPVAALLFTAVIVTRLCARQEPVATTAKVPGGNQRF